VFHTESNERLTRTAVHSPPQSILDFSMPEAIAVPGYPQDIHRSLPPGSVKELGIQKAFLLQAVTPSRRSHSPDCSFLKPRPLAFLFPRVSVTDPPWGGEPSAIGKPFPIPRLNPFPFPRVAPFAFPRVGKCCPSPGGVVVP